VDTNGDNFKMLVGNGKRYSGLLIHSGKWLAFVRLLCNSAHLAVAINGTVKISIIIPFDRNKSDLTWGKDDFILHSSNGAMFCTQTKHRN
jgi:hypothetical protein